MIVKATNSPWIGHIEVKPEVILFYFSDEYEKLMEIADYVEILEFLRNPVMRLVKQFSGIWIAFWHVDSDDEIWLQIPHEKNQPDLLIVNRPELIEALESLSK